jgi:hypothetical protein
LTLPPGPHYLGLIVLAFLVRLVQVLGLLLLVRLVLRALVARRSTPSAPRPATSDRDLVRDRVCNTFLPRERAVRAMVAGREEFFCSEGCRERGLREGVASLLAP